MTDQDHRRIDDYIRFLNKTFRLLILTGVVLLIGGIIIGLTANGSVYFPLAPGFLSIGVILILRSWTLKKSTPEIEDFLTPNFFTKEFQELMHKIKILSLVLIGCVMGAILITFISQWRFLIPTAIILTLYVVIEYAVWIIVRFRLQLLKQELKVND